MKKKLIIFCLFLFSCAFVNVEASQAVSNEQTHCFNKNRIITMPSLGEGFSSFSNSRIDIFKDKPICWNSVNFKKYDNFFENTYLLMAHFQLAIRCIELFKEDSKENKKIDQKSDFVITAFSLYEKLEKGKAKIESILEEAERLKKDASINFLSKEEAFEIKVKIDKVCRDILFYYNNFSTIVDNIYFISRNKLELKIVPRETISKSQEFSPVKTMQKTSKDKKVFYTLQFSSNKNLNFAKANIKKLKDKGYDAFMEEENGWYILFLGNFEKKEIAEEFGQEFVRNNLIKSFYIRKRN